MKIAYLLGPDCLFSSKGHGVKMQAEVWAEKLIQRGHEIDLISPWESYDINSYDIIHIFGTGIWLVDLVNKIYKKNSNIVLSPIIDSINSKTAYKLASFWGFPKIRLYSSNHSLRIIKNKIRQFYVRSNYEGEFISKSYRVNEKKIIKIPLSCRFAEKDTSLKKEPFCLTVSSICNKRKNVKRLIEAANKYNFKLVLAGNPGTEKEFEPLKRAIGDNPNIEVLGFVSQDKLHELYRRAKVFALPSIMEGVGLSALEAASFGCDIVITNIGGPKEYYDNLAYLVNPFDIDEIGKAVVSALETTKQPELKKHIQARYSLNKTITELEDSYTTLIISSE